MSFWTLDRVAAALGATNVAGDSRGALELTGITTDSRSVGAGEVFVALIGEKFDGHDFIESSIE